MKKIISFCLWGDNPKYTIGAIRNAQLANEIYPKWTCRFYVHKDVNQRIIDELQNYSNVELIMVSANPDWKFTINRFLAIDDQEASHVIFRDSDSRLNLREEKAVEYWIKEGTALHVMRDHPYHGSFPILAGMFGINKSKLPIKMIDMIDSYSKLGIEEQYHYDQIFLQNFIWDKFKTDCTIHDEFFSDHPFPTKRIENKFVGQSFDEKEDTPQSHIDVLNYHLK